MLLSFLIGLGQGLLHAMGPDHCAAVATFGTVSRRAALAAAIRFAVGHALVLGTLSALCLLAGVGLSEAFERWAEVLGGVVLIGVALSALFFPTALAHGHPHFGPHGKDHAHPRLPLATGALMALSGIRSLTLAMPPLVVGGSLSLSAWTYLPGFSLGILAGMGAVGLLLAAVVAPLSERAAENVRRVVAAGSALLGAGWIVSSW